MKRIGVIFIAYALLFGMAEIGSKLWIKRYGNALDITRSILETDPDLGWKQRAKLNTTFLGRPLQTNEFGFREQSFTKLLTRRKNIVFLGPSSTFGWGVSSAECYPRQLASRSSMQNFNVINAGAIGYSTAQGEILSRQAYMKVLSPEIVVIAYGINDLDRNRFYFQSSDTDHETFRKKLSPVSIFFNRIVFSSHFSSLLFKAAGCIRGIVNRSESYASNLVRVPPADFAENIEKIITEAGSAKVILLTTAISMPTDGLNQKDIPEVKRINRGVAEYNAILRNIALRKRLEIGDIDTWFARNSRRELFVDPIHFSARGNYLVAAGIGAIIEKNLQSSAAKK